MAHQGAAGPVTPLERIGYGLGDAACNIVFQMVMTFMAFFYTDVFGLDPAAMGTMFLVIRTLNAACDPLMGALCDRTETRWGKFRPYLLWMAIPFGGLAVLAFSTPALSPTGKLVYAYVTCSLLFTSYTAVNVPYCALGATITADSRERVTINGLRFFIVTAVSSVVVFTAPQLVDALGQGDARAGFQRTMMAFGAAAVVMLLVCFAVTRERVAPVEPQSGSLREDAACLFRNDQWRVTAAINLVLFVALVIQDGLAIMYLSWYVDRADLLGVFLGAGMLSAMMGAVVAGPMTARWEKARVYAALQAAIVMSLATLFFIDKSRLVAIFAVYAAIEFFTKAASAILWSMMADVVDYGELTTGRRIAGLTFSGSLLALKLGMAIGGALLGWLLAYIGYQSQSASQSSETVRGIVVLFTLVPAVGHLGLLAIVQGYQLDHRRCREIRAALDVAR